MVKDVDIKDFPASISLWVINKSAFDGLGLPEGWLWAKIIDLADFFMAGLKTSLGLTIDEDKSPIEISSLEITSFLLLRRIVKIFPVSKAYCIFDIFIGIFI